MVATRYGENIVYKIGFDSKWHLTLIQIGEKWVLWTGL